ncbi:hypothetical protein JCM10908_000628 [Rhodotorula pacifica]|uniref:uncharacterized protein n=1 Tax=Rhodotorula pacifica TaxID=1495444 RepID=UPI0031745035
MFPPTASAILHRRRSYSSAVSPSNSPGTSDSTGSASETDLASSSASFSGAEDDLLSRGNEKSMRRRAWVMHSHGKGGHHKQHHQREESSGSDASDGSSDGGNDQDDNAKDTLHLSKRTKGLITLVVLVTLCAAGGFVAWKYGTKIYAEVKDFVVFPPLKTPVDITQVLGSVWGEATEHVVGAFSTATAAVAGAEKTATSAVAQAGQTAVAAVTGAAGQAGDAAKDAGGKVTAGLGDAGKAIGGLFGGH